MKKWIALALMLAVLTLSLAVAESAQPEADMKIMTYDTAAFAHVFNAFFAEEPDDQTLVSLTAATLLGTTPDGDLIMDGRAGLATSYRGAETVYYGAGSVQVVNNADGTADYQLTLRPDIYFSDGVQADIDDVLFTLYVLCDPSYDGPISLRRLPIEGLKAYSGSTAPLSELLIEAGRDNMDFTRWNEAVQTEFWEELDAAGEALAQDVVDYILENYLSDEYTAEIGRTVEEVKADPLLQVQLGMTMWGYGEAYVEGMTAADYWQIMLDEYDGDVLLTAKTETVGPSLFDYIEDYEQKYGGIVQASDSPVTAVTGFVRTGDFSMTIRAEQEDEAILYALSGLPVMPLHYYGDESAYDYAADAFGFEKGDLSAVREKVDAPLGCGMYAYAGAEDGEVTLKPNPYYFGGEAAYEKVIFREN